MRIVLNLGEAPPTIEQSFKATTKLKHELPTDIETMALICDNF